jgi:hypothetical protein
MLSPASRVESRKLTQARERGFLVHPLLYSETCFWVSYLRLPTGNRAHKLGDGKRTLSRVKRRRLKDYAKL